MSTGRTVVEDDDPEMESLKRGDPAAALRRARANNAETGALIKFFQANPDIFPCKANEQILLEWCSRKNAVATKNQSTEGSNKFANTLFPNPNDESWRSHQH